MTKNKRVFVCNQCGAEFSQWAGQCTDCGAWNALTENQIEKKSRFNLQPAAVATVVNINEVQLTDTLRFHTGSAELDRVLGGGLVEGSLVLLGGDPGIGKSTLLLQCMCYLSQQYKVLYVTGEESLQQVAMRAQRLELATQHLKMLAKTELESILAAATQEKPKVMVIDSIQTIYTQTLASAPGGVSQVRECTHHLVQFAKQTNTVVLLIGHVTKEGMLAGPRVLEHMVDTVLYFEGEMDARYRILRAVKNRFGAVNELGIFAMTDRGLKEITNPSAIFLSRTQENVPGSIAMVTWEGSRPLLIEIQALVDQSYLTNPRRVAVGIDPTRLAMLLAVLHRHGGVATYNQDVFVNVVGGVKVMETASDLPVLLAILSSLRNKALPADLIAFGEVGLSGEIRPVINGQERLKEVAKHGFKQAIVPWANVPKKSIAELNIQAVKLLAEVIAEFK